MAASSHPTANFHHLLRSVIFQRADWWRAVAARFTQLTMTYSSNSSRSNSRCVESSLKRSKMLRLNSKKFQSATNRMMLSSLKTSTRSFSSRWPIWTTKLEMMVCYQLYQQARSSRSTRTRSRKWIVSNLNSDLVGVGVMISEEKT